MICLTSYICKDRRITTNISTTSCARVFISVFLLIIFYSDIVEPYYVGSSSTHTNYHTNYNIMHNIMIRNRNIRNINTLSRTPLTRTLSKPSPLTRFLYSSSYDNETPKTSSKTSSKTSPLEDVAGSILRSFSRTAVPLDLGNPLLHSPQGALGSKNNNTPPPNHPPLILTEAESRLFDLLTNAAASSPETSSATLRVAGGWVRDKLLSQTTPHLSSSSSSSSSSSPPPPTPTRTST